MSQNEQNTSRATSTKAAVRLRRPDRKQNKMVVQCADDLVSSEHRVRLVAEMVSTLDLSAFYEPIKAREGQAGQSSTDPALLVSLWLYASIRGIGSARELDRRCSREEGSAPFRWLCGDVTVNHHLLSDFRVDHAQALDELFTQVIALLVKKGLVKVSRISQDGLRVRASAGTDSFTREQSLEKLLEESKQHIEQLRKQLDDPSYSAGLSARQKAARERAAKDKQKRLEQAIAELPELKKSGMRRRRRPATAHAGRKSARKNCASAAPIPMQE